jgi:hypothetical protein
MNCLYYHDCDDYDKDTEDGVNKEDRCNVTKIAMKLELTVISMKMRIMVVMINRMIYPGSCMIIGMTVDVLMNMAMTENLRKDTGNSASKY